MNVDEKSLYCLIQMPSHSEPFSDLKTMILFFIVGNIFTREVFASSIIAKRFQFSTGDYRFVSSIFQRFKVKKLFQFCGAADDLV